MIIGTAGHVDHGKTLLVRRLTGVDTDRLAEEKRRGITIDLGFAYLPMSDGHVLGFVDVPGHERFIRTMVAGASGIRTVLLVIAANEGIKPQTTEHLQIIDMLGIHSGIVALNKIDLVDEDVRPALQQTVRGFLRNSNLADAEIVPVSAVTGEGIETLREKLFAIALDTAPQAEGAFRLAIDRSFSLVGAGTVVTGTVLSGQVAIGDEVLILPQQLPARVRSLHAQGREAPIAHSGQRCALNIVGRDISKDVINRGDWALAPTHSQLTDRVDAEITLLSTAERAVSDGTPVHIHVGASNLLARAIILSAASLIPGASELVQFTLSRPLPLRHGDRLVVRDASSETTIGGGKILDVRPPTRRKRSPERLATLTILRTTSVAEALRRLTAQSPGFVSLAEFAADRMLTDDEAASLAGSLQLASIPIGKDNYVTSEAIWQALVGRIEAVLSDYHRQHPHDAGMLLDGLRKALDWKGSPVLLRELVLNLARRRTLLFAPPRVSLASHVLEATPEDAKAQTRILELLDEEPLQPPRAHETSKLLGINEIHVRRLCKAMAQAGQLIEVATDRFFLRSVVVKFAEAADRISKQAPDRDFNAARFRDEIKTGRTTAIQVLEYFDRHGFTLRRGDLRRVVKDPRLVFGGTEDDAAEEENRPRWGVRTSNPGRAARRL